MTPHGELDGDARRAPRTRDAHQHTDPDGHADTIGDRRSPARTDGTRTTTPTNTLTPEPDPDRRRARAG